MIEIKSVGLINIDRQALAGLANKTKWVFLSIAGPHLRIHFEQSESRGAHRIRYYNTGAQIQAEIFIKDNLLKDAVYNTITRPRTISINLSKEILQ
jgi:hypothetical protein